MTLHWRGVKWLVAVAIAALLAGCAPNVEQMQAERDVAGLVELLGTSDARSDARADAATALGSIGDLAAVDSLLAALREDDATVRAAASSALGRLADEQAVVPLLSVMADEDPAVRAAAQSALEQVVASSDAVRLMDALSSGLADPDSTVRAAAAELLASTGDESAVGVLLAALDDEADDVRRAVERSLATLIDKLGTDASAALAYWLDDSSPTVRAAAAEALGPLGDELTVAPLLEAIADESHDVRAAVRVALGEVVRALPDATAARELIAGVRSASQPVNEVASAMLRQLLEEMGPDRAVAAMVETGAGDGWLATALGVAEAQLPSELRRLGIQLEPIELIETAAESAREGLPVDGGRPYEASDAFHPAVILGNTTGSAAWEGMQAAWAPSALRHLELVVIVGEVEWEQIEECIYDGPSIVRYRGTQTVRVVSAEDGALIAERAFTGPDPRRCAATEDYWLTELYGDNPDIAPAVAWLEPIIHPPKP